jgi:DNA-binding transcriptional LysR family regulator
MKELMLNDQPDHRSLHFGTTMTIGEFVIAKPLARYLTAHPDSEIEMTAANTSELLTMLKNGDIHFALVEGYFDSSDYTSLPYSTEDFVCVCSSAHIFSSHPSSIHDLLNERIIVREPGSGTRDILEKYLDASNLQLSSFRRIAQISGMHTIIDLVEHDCGITFLYKTAVAQAISDGRLIELQLEDFHVKHDFTFIWNKGSLFSDYYRKICTQLS